MSLFLWFVTIIFIAYTIFTTPFLLSRNMYKKFVERIADANMIEHLNFDKVKHNSMSWKEYNLIKFAIDKLTYTVMYILMIIYYIAVCRIVGTKFFIFLTVLQLLTVVYNYFDALTTDQQSESIIELMRGYRKLPLVFNVIVDYAYYITLLVCLL